MKTTSTYLVLALSSALSALAEPVARHELQQRASGFQSVDLSFQAGPVSYNLTIPADGKEYFTDNDLNVNIIHSDNYNPYRYCTFKTPGQVTLAPSLVQTPGEPLSPDYQIAVGPPSPIISVTCSGVCVGIYGDCEVSGPSGTFLLDCCNGYCAATKCRPFVSGS